MKHSPLRRNTGLTLIEIVVTVGIIGVLSIIVGKFQGDTFAFSRYFSNSFTGADNAQKLLRPMTEEIRSASTSASGAFPIDAISDYSFSFYSDIDNDTLKEWVRYRLSGSILYKETIEQTGNPASYPIGNIVSRTFMTGVRNQTQGVPIFSYYDSTYTGGASGVLSSSSSVDLVRLVGVTIILDEDTNQLPGPITITTQVAIRNLKIQL